MKRCYWVVPEIFLAGSYPGDQDPRKTDERLKWLVAQGFQVIISLMSDNDVNNLGQTFPDYRPRPQTRAQRQFARNWKAYRPDAES